MNIAWILALTIITGQLIKLPLGGSSGATMLDIAVGFLSLSGLIKIKFKLQKPPLYIKAALIFIVVTFSSLLLTPLKLTVPEYLTSFLYIFRFASFILLGWLIYCGAFPGLNKNIPQVLSTSGIALAVLGIFQLIFLPDLRFLANYGWDPHYFRTASTFLDPNFLGSYLVLTLLLLVASLQKTANRFWVVAAAAVVYLALLTTFSRGAYLAFLVSFLCFALLRRSFKLGVLSILLFLGLFVGFFTYQQLVAQPRNIDRTQSAQFRLNTWQEGWQLFQMHPVLGIGFNSYRYALTEYQMGDSEFLKSHGASTNDSSLLYVAATTGIIGLLSYLFFLGTLLISGAKSNYLLAAGLLGLIAQSFFANTLFYPPLLLWIVIISAIHKK